MEDVIEHFSNILTLISYFTFIKEIIKVNGKDHNIALLFTDIFEVKYVVIAQKQPPIKKDLIILIFIPLYEFIYTLFQCNLWIITHKPGCLRYIGICD